MMMIPIGMPKKPNNFILYWRRRVVPSFYERDASGIPTVLDITHEVEYG